jgi:hypothetical protein
MRVREITILVGVLLLLAGIYILAVKPFGRRAAESMLRENLLFPELTADLADTITIKTPSGTLTFTRTDNDWIIGNGRNFHADAARVRESLEAVAGLTKSELVSIVPDKHAVFEVDDRTGSSVVVRGGGTTLANLVVGKRGPDFVTAYVRAAGADEVYLSQPGLSSSLLRSVDDWRDRKVMTFAMNQVTTLTIETDEGGLVIDAGGETGWLVREPEEAPANTKRVEVLLVALGDLSALGFEDELSPAACGLDPTGGARPAATVTAELRAAPPQTIWIGGGDDVHRFVRRADRETIYRVSASTVEHILRDPADFVLTPDEGS